MNIYVVYTSKKRYMYIGGWGAETNREIVSFRSCVRAQLYVRSEWIAKIITICFPFTVWS